MVVGRLGARPGVSLVWIVHEPPSSLRGFMNNPGE